MKRAFTFLTIAFGIQLLFSCDPAQTIQITNASESDVRIIFKLDTTIKNGDLAHALESFQRNHMEGASNDSIVLKIKPNQGHNYAALHFGMGVWDEDNVNGLVNSLKYIEIETQDIITIYKSKSAMKKLLEDNKEGFIWKPTIELSIK